MTVELEDEHKEGALKRMTGQKSAKRTKATIWRDERRSKTKRKT